jgi:hypothetical protein
MSMNHLPDQFVCVQCGSPVTKSSSNTLRLIRGWVKGEGKSIQYVENDEYKYLHDWCLRGYRDGGPETMSLFE